MSSANASVSEFSQHFGRIYELLWKPLIDEARKDGQRHCEIEIGSPQCPTAERYLQAGSAFLAERGIPYCPVLVHSADKAPARVVLRIAV